MVIASLTYSVILTHSLSSKPTCLTTDDGTELFTGGPARRIRVWFLDFRSYSSDHIPPSTHSSVSRVKIISGTSRRTNQDVDRKCGLGILTQLFITRNL